MIALFTMTAPETNANRSARMNAGPATSRPRAPAEHARRRQHEAARPIERGAVLLAQGVIDREEMTHHRDDVGRQEPRSLFQAANGA